MRLDYKRVKKSNNRRRPQKFREHNAIDTQR